MNKCKHHQTYRDTHLHPFTGPLSSRPNPRAHGGYCLHEHCSRCGATRRTNHNQGATESTGWYLPAPAEAQ